MIESNKSVLIVTKSDRIGDGLQALLKTIPQVEIIGQVDNSPTALRIITEYSPNLVLLVINLPHQEAWQILEHLRDDPWTKCLVLTDTNEQQQQAKTMGATEVLLTGLPAAKLFEAVTRLLSS